MSKIISGPGQGVSIPKNNPMGGKGKREKFDKGLKSMGFYGPGSKQWLREEVRSVTEKRKPGLKRMNWMRKKAEA